MQPKAQEHPRLGSFKPAGCFAQGRVQWISSAFPVFFLCISMSVFSPSSSCTTMLQCIFRIFWTYYLQNLLPPWTFLMIPLATGCPEGGKERTIEFLSWVLGTLSLPLCSAFNQTVQSYYYTVGLVSFPHSPSPYPQLGFSQGCLLIASFWRGNSIG